MEIVTRWFGAYLVEKGKVVNGRDFPRDRGEILARWKVRGEGGLTMEERGLWEEVPEPQRRELTSRDARFRSLGVRPAMGYVPRIPARDRGSDPEWQRSLLSDAGKAFLSEALGPSQEIVEGVRSLQDLGEVVNLLGERLSNWWVNEAPAEIARSDEGSTGVARQMMDEEPTSAIQAARKNIAGLVLNLGQSLRAMETAVEQESASRFPNLSALLGPMLAARIIEKAGGIERLARLPAGTLQVLGAERAFFDHLRTGRAPPKYGLLFLHPAVQGAPTRLKGKAARILAGKAAIAARRDLIGAPALPELKTSLDARLKHLREGPRIPPTAP